MEKMLALVKEKPEVGLWMKEVPVPECGINDVQIKIRKTAICGTDMHIYNWNEWAQNTIKTPMTIGHEYVGEIVEVGANVTAYKVGDRVTGGRLALDGARHLYSPAVKQQLFGQRGLPGVRVGNDGKGAAALNLLF